MSTRCLFELRVNGSTREVLASPGQTLLEVLRDQLQITGPKRGCNQGVCGACTVIVDDKPIRACLSLASNLVGSEIMTVEGLGGPKNLTPLQRAILEYGAVQCGFCTSGMLMVAHALLKETRHPTSEEVRTALSGNLCRCSGYIKLIDAICGVNGEGAA
jgi:carbon-monoxide dehydrogenase small subunit